MNSKTNISVKNAKKIVFYVKYLVDLSEIYYDISLQAIISNIWGDPALQQTKCVKILKDGSW